MTIKPSAQDESRMTGSGRSAVEPMPGRTRPRRTLFPSSQSERRSPETFRGRAPVLRQWDQFRLERTRRS